MILSILFGTWIFQLILGQVVKEPRPQPWPLSIKSVGRCCDKLDSPEELIRCANSSISMSRQTLSKSKVAIFTYVSSDVEGQFAMTDIWSFASYQIALLSAYAEQNHYTFRLLTEADTTGQPREHDVRWYKVSLLLAALNSTSGWAREADFLVWVDADAIFLDFGMKVESIAEQYPYAHMIASADVRQGYINSGVLVVRNSAWARNFLARWWSVADRKALCDQDAFDVIYKLMLSEQKYKLELGVGYEMPGGSYVKIEELIQILPRDALNSDPPAATRQLPHNQVLHLMGESSSMRAASFREAMLSVCNARSGGVVPVQLGLPRHRLIELAIHSYRTAKEQLIQKLDIDGENSLIKLLPKRHMNSRSNTVCEVIELLEELSRVTHHLCDLTLAQPSQSSSTPSFESNPSVLEVLSVRREVFSIAMSWVEEARTQMLLTKTFLDGDFLSISKKDGISGRSQAQNQAKDLTQTLVALLKLAAEAGNDLFRAELDPDERRAAAKVVFTIIEELKSRLAPESRPIATHMAALMHQNLGVLELELHQKKSNSWMHNDPKKSALLASSRAHFNHSLILLAEAYPSSHPPDRSAALEQLESLQLLAATCCLQFEFSEGLELWNSALSMAEKLMGGVQLGRPLEAHAEISFNAALCHQEAGLVKRALMLVQQAEKFAVATQSLASSNNSGDSQLLRGIRAFLRKIQGNKIRDLEYPGDVDDVLQWDEWEECAEGEEGCDAFELDQNGNIAKSSNSETGHLTNDENDETRKQYTLQASRYIANTLKQHAGQNNAQSRYQILVDSDEAKDLLGKVEQNSSPVRERYSVAANVLDHYHEFNQEIETRELWLAIGHLQQRLEILEKKRE